MSRPYSMQVQIRKIAEEKVKPVCEALAKETVIDWACAQYTNAVDHDARDLCLSGEDNLCGGETEEEFSKRVAIAIWKANEDFCKVIVYLTPLDNSENYPFDEVDYKKIMEGGA